MHTIQLKISEKVYDRFLWLLGKFNKDEIEIINDNNDFLSTRNYLQKELEEIQSSSSKFLSQDEFENRLDQII